MNSRLTLQGGSRSDYPDQQDCYPGRGSEIFLFHIVVTVDKVLPVISTRRRAQNPLISILKMFRSVNIQNLQKFRIRAKLWSIWLKFNELLLYLTPFKIKFISVGHIDDGYEKEFGQIGHNIRVYIADIIVGCMIPVITECFLITL